MAFKFRLQAVLEHRQHLEDVALRAYAKKLRAEQDCRRQIQWLDAEHKRARKALEEKEFSGMSAPEFQLANEYATVLRLQSLREQSRLPMLEGETEAARGLLLEARKDRKALDILRDAHKRRWDKQQLIEEQKALDEAAVAGFNRRETA